MRAASRISMKAGIRAWLYSRRAAPRLQVPAVAARRLNPHPLWTVARLCWVRARSLGVL